MAKKPRNSVYDLPVDRWTIHLSFVSFAVALVSVGFTLVAKRQVEKPVTFNQQMKRLDETSEALVELQRFIAEQKRSVVEAQAANEALKKEHDSLKPVVEADKKTVDAVFAVLEQRQKRSDLLQQVIGFFVGVASTAFCAGVGFAARWLWKKYGPGRNPAVQAPLA